jgi:hypothetical protein
MTDREELETLAARMDDYGAIVRFRRDEAGHVVGVTIGNAFGIGPHEMAPLSAAERMRYWLSYKKARA